MLIEAQGLAYTEKSILLEEIAWIQYLPVLELNN